MVNIAVCDDEKYMSEKIRKMAEDFFGKKNTDISVAEYSSGEELLKSRERMDILFLDIGMRGMDGMETARRLRAHGYKGFLVFITVLKEMVFRSFEVQPFDYLVKRGKHRYSILSAVLGMAVLVVFGLQGISAALVFILLLMAAGKLLYGADLVSSALYAVVTVEIMNLCFGFMNSLSYMLASIVFVENPKIFGFLFIGAGNILALVLAVLCYRGIEKSCGCDETAGRKYVFAILMPALLVFLSGAYINETIYGDTVTVAKEGMPSGADPCQALLMQSLGAASLFCILFSYKKLAEGFKRNKEAELWELQAHSLQRYVDGMGNLTADLSFPVSTNHPVLDILLGNKLGIAEENGMEVQCSLAVPYPCGIRDIDFCILLGNALDNAISACNRVGSGRQKYIHVSGKVQGDFLLMEIENSCSGGKMLREGTGLTNIRAAVEKYHGALEIRTEGEKFVLSILVIIPQQSGSILRQAG